MAAPERSGDGFMSSKSTRQMVMAMPLPGFVKKTWDILDRAEHQDLVSWSPAGDSILVHQVRIAWRRHLADCFKRRGWPRAADAV